MTSRRDFMRGCAAVAVVAAVFPVAALAQPAGSFERLNELMRGGGLIEGETFILDEGESVILTGRENVWIRYCVFIRRAGNDAFLTFTGTGPFTARIEDCTFRGEVAEADLWNRRACW